MPSAVLQTITPPEHFGQSRLTTTIIALVALAFVLAAVFIYLQSGQRVQPANNVLTAQAKAHYIQEMQAVVASQPALPADQKASLIQAMEAKLQK